MTDLMQKALAAIRNWPAERQDDAAGMLLALDRLGPGGFMASADELRAIDEALSEVKRGEFASPAQVESAYAKFRK